MIRNKGRDKRIIKELGNYYGIVNRESILRRNKRGSIPVTILVILTIALFAFTLLAFSLTKGQMFNKIGKNIAFIEKFNLKDEGREFLGQPDLLEDAKVNERKTLGIIGTGEFFDEIRVREIER